MNHFPDAGEMVAGEYSPCHKAGPEMSQLGQPPQENQGFWPFECHNSLGGMSRLGEYSPWALLPFSLFSPFLLPVFSLPSPSPSLLLPRSFRLVGYRGSSVCSRWEIFIGERERGPFFWRGFGAAQGLFSSSQRDGVALAVNRTPAVLKQAGIYGAVSCALIIVHDNRRAWR